MFGGLFIPFQCFGVILGDAVSGVIARAKMILSLFVPLFGSFSVPLYRFGTIRLYASAVTETVS